MNVGFFWWVKEVRSLEGVEENFEAYKIQNRSTKDANQISELSFKGVTAR